jgi:hypothetical protein
VELVNVGCCRQCNVMALQIQSSRSRAPSAPIWSIVQSSSYCSC